MAGKQFEFSAKKAGKGPLFDEIWLEFQILYQWTPCKRPPISPQNRNQQRTKFRNQQSSTKNLP